MFSEADFERLCQHIDDLATDEIKSNHLPTGDVPTWSVEAKKHIRACRSWAKQAGLLSEVRPAELRKAA